MIVRAMTAALAIGLSLSSATATELSPTERATIAYECQMVLFAYSQAQDQRDAKALAGVFSDDATWKSSRDTAVGREAITKKAEAYIVSEGALTSRHIISNVMIEPLDGNRTIGSAYVTDYYYDAEKLSEVKFLAPILIGVYMLKFVRTEKGWRIQHMELARDAATFR